MFGIKPLRVVSRQQRKADKLMNREHELALKEHLKNAPKENLQALIRAAQQAHAEEHGEMYGPGAGSGEIQQPGSVYSVPLSNQGPTQMRTSPIGGKSFFGLGSATVVVPFAGALQVTWAPTQIISPSFFRPSRLVITQVKGSNLTGIVTQLNINTFNQFASLGAIPFEQFDPQNFNAGALAIQDIPFGAIVSIVGIIFPAPGAVADVTVTVSASLEGERLA